MLALLLVAVSLAMSNFAGAIALGLAGTLDLRLRLRVAVIFGLFEGGMPLLGLLLGRPVAGVIGSRAHLVGGVLLVILGLLTIVSGVRARGEDGGPAVAQEQGLTRILVAGLALSIDNLVAGFALGTRKVSLIVAGVVFALTSVAFALVGLELGDRLGAWAERSGELTGGVVLIAVGVAIAAGVL